MNSDNKDQRPGEINEEDQAPNTANEEARELDVTNEGYQEPVTRTPRIQGWSKVKTLGPLIILAVTVLQFLGAPADVIDLLGQGKGLVLGATEEKAVEATVRGHYEAIGTGDLEKAYSYFGTVGQAKIGSLQSWLDTHKACPVESSTVNSIRVGNIDGDEATATVDVGFKDKCEENRFVIIWNLTKEDGKWKLASQRDDSPGKIESSRPIPFENGAPTESVVKGETKQAKLETVRTSATVTPGVDACGNTVTVEPWKVVDSKPDTAWQVAGDGKEQWVLLEYDEAIKVNRVGIIPGYSKIDPCDSTDRFYQSHVVRKARIEFSNGSSQEVTFQRAPEMQFVKVPATETTSVRITILDTYPPGDKPDGSSYPQVFGKTGISEIQVEES